MRPEAESLYQVMLRISRDAYPSGRLQHLEFVLWYALIHGPMEYGQHQITAAEVSQLRALSDACGGWVVMGDDNRPRWMPAAEWQDLFTRKIDLVKLD